ncbi:hypothetical protein DRQ07_04955 [candidate division KSB1 bacterium]|nr:MAG: hypothetical protein DRQ07_04955 [candidate division KSB1 bacterium]
MAILEDGMKKRLFVMMNIAVLIMFCASRKENVIDVKLEKVSTIGKNDGSENEIFAKIQDFCFDNAGNIYVLDSEFLNIKVYDKNNNLVNVIGGNYGQGPGEFLQPRSIDVDSLLNIYVVDYRKNDITVFNRFGKILTVKKVRPKTSLIKVGKPFEVYGLAHPLLFKGNLIDYYNLKINKGIPRVASFCERQHGKDSLNIVNSGYFGDIDINKNNEIFYAFPYPYEIRRFLSDGKLTESYKRRIPYFKPPDKKSGVLDISTGVEQIVTFSNEISDNLLLCKYYRRKYGRVKNCTKYYFDFWDMKKGELLCTYTDKQLNLVDADWVKIDSKGYLYASYSEEYPHVDKFKLTINKK